MPSHERVNIQMGPVDGKISRTPYYVDLSPDGKTADIKAFGFIPYMRTPVYRMSEPVQTIQMAVGNRSLEVVKSQEEGWYLIGDSGLLIMEEHACSFIPRQGTVVFWAHIPDESVRNGIFSAMIQFGADMAENSGIKG